MVSRFVATALIVLTACALAAGCGGGKKDVKIEGSTTVLPLANKWATAFEEKEGVAINLNGNGSGTGIAALQNGMVECAMASRAIKPAEKEACEKKGFKPVEHIIAYDGLSIIVSRDNPLEEITLDQLMLIYNGSVKTWKEVFPNLDFDQPLMAITRDSNSGTFEFFHKAVLKKKEFRGDITRAGSNQEVVNGVIHDKGAIGYCGLGYYLENKDKVKALRVKSPQDGVFYTPMDFKKYPLVRPLFFYTRGDAQGSIADFIEFATSEEGEKITTETGFIAPSAMK
jgi:phosphate transport system substrate-binding protein